MRGRRRWQFLGPQRVCGLVVCIIYPQACGMWCVPTFSSRSWYPRGRVPEGRRKCKICKQLGTQWLMIGLKGLVCSQPVLTADRQLFRRKCGPVMIGAATLLYLKAIFLITLSCRILKLPLFRGGEVIQCIGLAPGMALQAEWWILGII